MAFRFADELLPWNAMNTQCYLIGHGPAGHKNRGLFAQQVRGFILQINHGWVDVDHIIADGCPHHGIEHSRGRLGNSVAS